MNYRPLYAFVLTGAFSLALSIVTPTMALAQGIAQDAPKAVPIFTDGMAQEVPQFKQAKEWIKEYLWVQTEFDSDGDGKLDRMHVDVTRPKQTKTEGLKVPVIYETSPYYMGTGTLSKKYFWDPKQELNVTPPERSKQAPVKHRAKATMISQSLVRQWVPRGFAVVHSCSPGTGRSEGCPSCGGDNEALAPKAVIDWLNGRAKGFTSMDGNEEITADWCTGKVGMTGTSYNGTLPVAAATTGVEGLEAIIPVAPNTSYYHYYRSHGLVRHPGGYMGEDIDVLYEFINSGETETREHCNCKVRDELLQAKFDRVTGDYNDFWAGRDYANKLENYRAATLMAHAFNDWNVMPEHSVRIYEALKLKGVPCQAFFHQGGHGGDPPLAMMNRWFTRYLYGVENGVEQDPKSWIVRENSNRKKPTAYPEYPHPDAKLVTLFPSADGLNRGKLDFVAAADGKPQTLIDNYSFKGANLAMADWSNHRLLFATNVLKEEVHISGTAKMKIRLAVNKPAANLSVWIVSLPWAEKSRRITDNVITRGWADPQNYASLDESQPLEPGKFYDLQFTLQPDDQVLPVGAQIGLMIFSSDKDFTLWPEPGTELTVDLNGTSLQLPIVGGEERLGAAVK